MEKYDNKNRIGVQGDEDDSGDSGDGSDKKGGGEEEGNVNMAGQPNDDEQGRDRATQLMLRGGRLR